MFIFKQRERFYKNEASMAASDLFKPNSSSRDEETPEFPTPNLLTKLSNSIPSLAICQAPKYNKDDV